MSPEVRLSTLRAHEWQLKEDLKTYVCVSCGSQYRGKNLSRLKHRKGCWYAAIVSEAEGRVSSKET